MTLLAPCRDPFRDRLGGLDVQEVTDVGDDLQRVRGGEPMSVVDLRGEEAAVVGTVKLQQGHRDRLRETARRPNHAGSQHRPVVLERRGHARPQVLVQLCLESRS